MPRRLKKSPRDVREARRARRQALEPDSNDTPPSDIDEVRYALARRINRFIGNRQQFWRNCPERMCRRQRACAAPRIGCSNAPVLPPDPDREARALAEVQRALKVAMARQQGAQQEEARGASSRKGVGGQGKSDPGSGVYPPRLPSFRGTRPRT